MRTLFTCLFLPLIDFGLITPAILTAPPKRAKCMNWGLVVIGLAPCHRCRRHRPRYHPRPPLRLSILHSTAFDPNLDFPPSLWPAPTITTAAFLVLTCVYCHHACSPLLLSVLVCDHRHRSPWVTAADDGNRDGGNFCRTDPQVFKPLPVHLSCFSLGTVCAH